MRKLVTDIEFFNARTNKLGGGCWYWTGSRYTNGYGEFRDKYSHRMSWELHVGPIPDGGQVLHKCDNRRCVKPEHLYIGTDKENRRDAIARKRYPGNARSSRAKLTEKQVIEIKRLRGNEFAELSREKASVAIAKMFGVSRYTIRSILAGHNWNHI